MDYENATSTEFEPKLPHYNGALELSKRAVMVGMLLVTFCIYMYRRSPRLDSASTKYPPMLPYRIPLVGHMLSFVANSEALISYGRSVFSSIFEVNILGNPIYVLTSPSDIAAVHNDPALFNINRIVSHIMKSLGMSKRGAHQLTVQNPEGVKKPTLDFVNERLTKQTSGNDLKSLAANAAVSLQDRLFPANLLSDSSLWDETRGTKCISLKKFVRPSVINTLQGLFFGDALSSLDPKLPETLISYSSQGYKAWYQYPWFLRLKLDRHIRRLQGAFKTYSAMPEEKRPTDVWFTQELHDTYRGVGASEKDLSVVMHFFYWGLSMNPANATFWFVTHIVSSPTLMAEIRAEIEPAFKSDGTLDTYYLVNHCPILDSVWNEILRYYVCVTTMRYITAPASLNDYSLKEGQNLLYSARQLAHDPAAFGPDFASFNPYRFRDDPSLQHSESFRPFGGGKHICPGRHLAKHVAAAFVALLLRNYDITMPYEQGFPRFFECEPAIGILGTEDDLFIELKERT